MSWTEIAIEAAEMIARQQGCELAHLSVDGVEICERDGTDVVTVKVSCLVTRAPDHDEILFDLAV